ncbi:SusC/RagA family TonB-linked outer membrane protein [Spirosoma oryzicola]|uniref:SusC/RagA family TonB-linked outer membrane protein n=1 Tax=Spirosoma oryzicola TaxID=2898794 RepID=UPI001E540F50|nr:TonB-dependent receptor [Spirosoma oryzicola]UHG93799.1 TonB-dependent receptor [Spirosoma oryzicola]
MNIPIHHRMPLITWSGKQRQLLGLLLFLLNYGLLASSSAFAALNIELTGQVLDEQQKPLPGATVSVVGTTIGTTTDENGKYRLSLPDNYVGRSLAFSYIGYTKKTLVIGQDRTINVTLTADSGQSLDEVVVVGYGRQDKLSVTGAVDQIKSQSIEGKPVTNVLQALQGESPNLIIQQTNFSPGSGVNINIRGLGTLGDNTPLIVIDGIIGGDINLLNPNDIASVSVLKDAGSAAIYGSRSANGVLLITTKGGKLNQKATITYNGSYGLQTPYVGLHKVSAWDNAYYKNLSLINSGLPPIYTPDDIQALKAQGNGDWERQSILQSAPQQLHNISITGGGANSSYLISAGLQDQRSNFVGPSYGYKKYNLRLNQLSVIGKLRVNTILNYVKSSNKSHSNTDWVIFADADRVPLNYSFQDAAGNYLTNPVASQYNVKSVLEQGGSYLSDNDQFFGNLNAELSITKDLKLTGIFGGTQNANNAFFRRLQVNNYPSGVYGNDRTVYDNSFKNSLLNTQLFADYTKRFGAHSIKVLLGASDEHYRSNGFQLQKTLTDPALGTPTTGTILDPVNSYNSNASTNETRISSVFGRVNYSFKDRYYLEGNFRQDGSSKFASGRRWGFFPSLSGSWILSEESFMEPTRNALTSLKLRASYGLVGNQNVNAYQYQTNFFNYANAYGFNNAVVGGAGFNLGNPDLTWEKSAILNVGTDASFFQNKLSLSLDYFNKVTSDILYSRQDIPLLFGAGFPDYNVAKVKNTGWEVSATYNLNTKAVKQSFSVNLADNKNTLLALTYGSEQQISNVDAFGFIRKVGQPITQYWGYQTNGFFQNQADVDNSPKPDGVTVGPGDLKFTDFNGDGKIDDSDKIVLGNPFPRYTFGFTYRLAVKGFDLNLFIQGVGKRDVMLRGETVEPFHYNYGATLYEHQTDFWTPTNQNARYPRLAAIGSPSNTNNWRFGSDVYRYSGAYARLRNVQVGYTIPAAVTQKFGVQRLRVSLIGQNLLTLTQLKFIDPETSEFNNNLNLNASSNSGRNYPLPIFYGFGLDLSL